MLELKSLAKDLTKERPRSPRETLGGYVIAARALDICRAVLNNTQGPHELDTPLDREFFEFTRLDPSKFKEIVATGATDAEVADWIGRNARPRIRVAIIRWNNQMREMRLSELPVAVQEFMEDYVAEHLPHRRPVYCWFDVYDLEEERI